MKQLLRGVHVIFNDKASYFAASIGMVGLSGLYYWLLLKVTTITDMVEMAKNGDFGLYSYAYLVSYWALTILAILFFGVAVAALVWLWRRSLLSKGGLGTGGLGGLVGAFAAACPMCGAFLLSLIGVAGGLSLFPLQGLELKLLSLLLIVGSVVFAARRVDKATTCKECSTENTACVLPTQHTPEAAKQPLKAVSPFKLVTGLLIVLFLINQFYINRTAQSLGLKTGNIVKLLGIQPAAAKTIIAPLLNTDGKTTSLVEQPTITEVPGNPRSGDVVLDAKAVMMPEGKPFYAPDDISFDDPINAQDKWGAYEKTITLPEDLKERYTGLVNSFTCNYCCGGPNDVAVIANCGCKHAKAWRGYFKYMLQTYGSQYSDEQLKGEAYRWTGVWYPKGVLEDYLLATGRENAMPHETHGGAGADGKHGYLGT